MMHGHPPPAVRHRCPIAHTVTQHSVRDVGRRRRSNRSVSYCWSITSKSRILSVLVTDVSQGLRGPPPLQCSSQIDIELTSEWNRGANGTPGVLHLGPLKDDARGSCFSSQEGFYSKSLLTSPSSLEVTV